jgi:hypothetical protein
MIRCYGSKMAGYAFGSNPPYGLLVWREPPPHRIFDAMRPPPQAGEVK